MNKVSSRHICRTHYLGEPSVPPPVAGTREESLAAFVTRGRELAARLGLDFEVDAWEVSRLLKPRHGRRACPTRYTLRFGPPPGGEGEDGPWPRPVADVAKATLAGLLGRTSSTPLTVRLDVFRSFARRMDPRPLSECTMADLDATAADLHARYAAPSASLRVARLRAMAVSMERAGLVRPGLADWRPRRMGVDAALRETAPRGTAACLHVSGLSEAIARCFARAVRPRDVLTAGACTLMQFVPTQLAAVLDLEEGCLDECGEGGVQRLLIRLPAANCTEPRARWVPREMTEVAELAVRRIHDVTAEARAIKRWYDGHPDRLHLPPRLEHLRERDWLTVDEVSSLLGLAPLGVPRYARRHGLALRLHGRAAMVSFADIEALVLGRLRSMMELSGGRGRRPLMLLKWQIKNAPEASECMFEPFRTPAFTGLLMPQRGQVGMLERLGADPSRALKVGTEGWRKALAQAAVRGGLGRDDLLDWFAHSDPGRGGSFENDLDAPFRDAVTAKPAIQLSAGPGGRGPRPTTGDHS